MLNIQQMPAWLRFIGINGYGWWLRSRRFNKAFRHYLRLLKETQHWHIERLQAYQAERLSMVLKEAARHVPFYGRHFAACGFNPSQFSNLRDLEQIEPVSKSQLHEAGKNCLHEGFKRFRPRQCYTSGTTGEKFAYYVPDELRYAFKFATIWRQYAWAGVQLFDRRVTLGGRSFTNSPPYWVYNCAENQLLLSIHHLNEKTASEYYRKMRRFNPVFLQGHPSGIDFLARYMLGRDWMIPLKAIFTTGETLFPGQRSRIERAFNCKVFEEYGQGECVIAAQESELHGGLHEVSELGYVEFDPIEQNGLREVIGTSLWNRVMPFIRYRIEDLVEPASNAQIYSSRIGLPIKINRVVGRVDENLLDTQGNVVLAVTVRMHIKPLLNNSENYQIIQVGRHDYVLRLTGVRANRDISQFKREMSNLFGKDALTDVQLVDSLTTTGGKARNVVNEYGHAQIGD